MPSHSSHSSRDLHNATVLLRAALHLHTRPAISRGPEAPRLFVTISRQPGAAGRSLGRRLVERLQEVDRAGQWSCWDQELVEKVSAEHDIEKTIVQMLEDGRHTWLTDLLGNLSSSDVRQHPDELKVYRRVATTIRALADAGRAVIVGRGGVFLTAGMPGGIHLRLVSPLSQRIAHTAEREGISRKQAEARVAEIERNRDAFYRRHWPGKSLGPEAFTLTLNSSELTCEEMVDCVLQMIASRMRFPQVRPPEVTTTGGAQTALPHVSQAGAV